MAKKEEPKLEASTGNVFEDLGFADANQRLAKAELAMRVVEVIEKRELTQREASKILGIPQSNVSDLINGKLRGFSTDRLIRFLLALGRNVNIQISATRSQYGSYKISGPGNRQVKVSVNRREKKRA
ncbi:MAG: XRE family transcriptional regulator [Candidatus Eisenbacteria bacterium]|uniref:XRE family transcriptional regulator n=1 Tax=Eiseniibacteriota bacterium TaxID=2212470 RepID=A0A7Y2E706_UNCEI|nr:XRE family transcriptional regulator [Candidatus Eisenbacteria bacterium]